MSILVDTNILARLAQQTHRQHAVASQAIEQLRMRDDELCVVPQVLYELWVVCTRPPGENGLGMSVAEAESEIEEVEDLFLVLRDERAILPRWRRLVVDQQVKGKNAHDARLVAAMMRHGLSHILTFNTADFARYPGITTLTPEQVVGERG